MAKETTDQKFNKQDPFNKQLYKPEEIQTSFKNYYEALLLTHSPGLSMRTLSNGTCYH